MSNSSQLGSMRTILGLVAMVLVSTASAETCSVTVDAKEFERRGGSLTEEIPIRWAGLPQNFLCDRRACYGEVQFSGLIDESGRVRNLTLIGNTWPVRPAEHAALIRERALDVRYKPPRIGKRPVCVRMKWDYQFVPNKTPP